MDPALEERKLHYIQTIAAEYAPQEKNYWEHPAPTYSLTKNFAVNNKEPISADEPVTFKKAGKQWVLIAIMLIIASLLIYSLARNEFSLTHVIFLLLLLIVVLPALLNNEIIMRITHDGILFAKENKNLSWAQVVLTYIKTVHEEQPGYFLIVHYYDEGADAFKKMEINLDGLGSPNFLSAAIEAHKPA